MMLNLYKLLLRPLLFRIDPETAHERVMKAVARLKPLYGLFSASYSESGSGSVEVGKLRFRSRLGLAAGFDKNGEAVCFWDAVGFSHVEVGTVTPLPQPGNPKPRVFRLPADSGIINRLGFNNKGAEVIRENILNARKHVSRDFIIGVNIGKNKATPVENAVTDYVKCFEILFEAADYFTVNVSSPNTPGLRQLQKEDLLDELLTALNSANEKNAKANATAPKDIYLKIAPDIDEITLRKIFDICIRRNVAAIIATNTTVSRKGLATELAEEGGLSGRPLNKLSDSILKRLGEESRFAKGKAPELIGVGGVFERADFERKLSLGAKLVQVYTGFIYEGPAIIKNILKK